MAKPWRILAFVGVIGASALAPAKPTLPTKTSDPNEIVCESVKLSGSRAVAKKVCGTRAQWAELRRRERELAKQSERPANDRCQTVAMYPMSPGC